jgi:hypothetical protein
MCNRNLLYTNDKKKLIFQIFSLLVPLLAVKSNICVILNAILSRQKQKESSGRGSFDITCPRFKGMCTHRKNFLRPVTQHCPNCKTSLATIKSATGTCANSQFCEINPFSVEKCSINMNHWNSHMK